MEIPTYKVGDIVVVDATNHYFESLEIYQSKIQVLITEVPTPNASLGKFYECKYPFGSGLLDVSVRSDEIKYAITDENVITEWILKYV